MLCWPKNFRVFFFPRFHVNLWGKKTQFDFSKTNQNGWNYYQNGQKLYSNATSWWKTAKNEPSSPHMLQKWISLILEQIFFRFLSEVKCMIFDTKLLHLHWLKCMLYVEHLEPQRAINSVKFSSILGPPKCPPEIWCENPTFAKLLLLATLVPNNGSTFL